MALTFRRLHPHFVAEVGPGRSAARSRRETLDAIRAGMDEYAVLVFRDQPFTDEEQLAFAQRFDGELHAKTGAAVLGKNRFGNEALTDISNVDEKGEILHSPRTAAACTRSATASGTPTRRSRIRPGATRCCRRAWSRRCGADTEFADMRGAYDALDAADQGDARRPARAPFDRLLAADARLRVLAGGGGQAQRRGPSARAHQSAHRAPIAVPRIACLAHHRTGRCPKDGCCCAT